MDFKQQFKEYYEKKLQEDIELAQKSAAEQSYQTQAMNSSLDAVVMKYVGNGDIKEGLKQLATDLGTAIYNYIISDRYVQDELLEPGQEVKGIIIGLEADNRLKRALSVCHNIEFYRYQIDFKLIKS